MCWANSPFHTPTSQTFGEGDIPKMMRSHVLNRSVSDIHASIHDIYRESRFFDSLNKPRMKVYYINLAHRTDREQQLLQDPNREKTGWEYERIDATLDSNGALGCGKSHIKALDRFVNDVDNTDPYSIIMEDDFMFTLPGNEVNCAVEKAVSHNPNVVCLAYRLIGPASSSPLTNGLLEINRCFTTSCYVVRREYVKTLRECFRNAVMGLSSGLPNCVSAIDVAWCKLQGPGRGFLGISPKGGCQRPGYSDIEKRYCDYRLQGA